MEAPSASGPGWRVPRRVATTPISLHTRHEASSQSGALVETLYYHPNIKIVAFTASARAISRSPSRGTDVVDKEEVGTLSWSSQLERTIAVGPFRIYRAPASVAFLSCGSALQPILPKSQSWCLDEANSRFVLQIRRPNYWRLELSVDDPENQQLAQNLRGVLDTILQFEKTPCPFKRTFTVLLPEPPQEPVKKKPWKPVRRSLPDMGGPPSTPPGRPLDAAHTHTAPIMDIKLDPSGFEASTDSNPASRDASPVSTTRSERSAGLTVFARETRAVSDSAITVSTLVKQFDERSENETPVTPTMSISSASKSATPDGRATSPWRTSKQPEPTTTSQLDTPASLHTSEPDKHDSVRIESNHDHDQSVLTQKASPNHDPIEMPEVMSKGPGESMGSDLEIHVGAGNQSIQRKVRLRRSTGFGSIRRVTPTRQSVLDMAVPIPEPPIPVPVTEAEDPGDVSSTESEDSFHSVESWHSPDAALLPSPPISRSDVVAKLRQQPYDDSSDTESESSERSATTAPDDSVSAHDDDDEEKEDQNSKVEDSLSAVYGMERTRPIHRAPASFGSLRRRALSPLPPATSIILPSSVANKSLVYNNNRLEAMKKIPMAIINKTCAVLLGPPLHLLALMLKVAGKIASGQWRGQEYGYGADGEQIPVQWDYSDDEADDPGASEGHS
ncbi:hypothetical protein HJFPF1_09930 [Paramyrothecium foliicola]|nr:hypothetical protein HJFPF1_09930 [Paramyrothecium foliicola]